MPKIITDDKQIQNLLTRGVENIYPNEVFLTKELQSGKQLTLYSGYDPTADTLHIGHGITLMKLKQFQDLGHQIIMLIGDFTGMIGDPTDKTSSRQKLTKEQVLENCKNYQQQAASILNFEGSNPVKIEYNSKWFRKMLFEEVVDLSSHFTVQHMLTRDMFEKRIQEEKPIYLHEFLYPLMQGYDSVAMDVDGEVGGNDQTFNMLAGRTLMKALKNKEKFVLTMKLLADESGKKMGKSEGNMIALKDSASEMFGKIMSWTDGMIFSGFELCTNIETSEIEQMKKEMSSGTNPRDFKIKLAKEIVGIYHGPEAGQEAEENFINQFQKHQAPEDMPTHNMEHGTWNIIDLLVEVKLVSSKTNARQMIEQKAVKIDGELITDDKQEIEIKDGMVVQKGKRGFIKISKS